MPWKRMPCRSSRLGILSFTSPAACRLNCWQRRNIQKQSLSGCRTLFLYRTKFFGHGFYCFCSCGMKDPQGFMPARQIKGQAQLETLGWVGGMKALEELIPQECFLCFCQWKQFFDSKRKSATLFCAIRYKVPLF